MHDRQKLVLGLWLALLVIGGGVSNAVGNGFRDEFNLPDSESRAGFDILDESFAGQGTGLVGTIVFRADQGVQDPAVRQAMQALFDKAAAIDDVVRVQSPYAADGAQQILFEEDTMGALNMYYTAPNAFDGSDVALATVFAVHASVAMSAARQQESLEQKAETRDVIGRAKGILMARSGAIDEEAFAMLKAASQRMNVKLREIAQQIAEQKPVVKPPE